MKSSKSLTYILLVTLALVISCKSDDSPPTSAFSSKPDAQSSDNAKSGGVYKGVLVGSTGFLVVVLQGGKKEARVNLDGEERVLATTSLDAWSSGQLIHNAVFTSGDWTVTFSVGAAGQGASVQLDLAGHPGAEAVLLKELSTDQVRAYVGTYSGTDSGTWNFLVQGPVLSGVSRNTAGSSSLTFYGIVNGNTLTLEPPITGSGTISVDNVSGTWQTDTAVSGTWTGKRVL